MGLRRVVVTGTGCVSPAGNSPEELHRALLSGTCAVKEVPEWTPNPDTGGTRRAARVSISGDDVKTIPRASRRTMGSVAVYAALAAEQAVADSGLTKDEISGGRCACVAGSTMGASNTITDTYRKMFSGGAEDISAMQFFKCVSHTVVLNTAHLFGMTGVVKSTDAACASGLQAVGEAAMLIASGVQDMALCGGAEEVSPEVCSSFELIYAAGVSNELPPEKMSRPFDSARCGLVCGEGAGMLVLEEYGHAKKRGAKIYGEVLGYSTCGCGDRISQSDPGSMIRCFDTACFGAGISPSSVGYINAHATSTLQGDAAEAEAIGKYFGSGVPVSSLKGNIGHTLGASGAIELVETFLMMRDSLILPTLNLEKPGADCAGVFHVRETMEREIDVFMKNCFAFGGINATLLCGKSH